MAKIRIGVSGWTAKAWEGDFYPEDLPRDDRLEYLASVFPTVEVNGSFYSLQTPDTFRGWYEEVPADFRFAVKGSRFITHNKKLGDVRGALANFLASGVLALEEKLGPILWQLPDRIEVPLERIENFLDILPRDAESAAELAAEHDYRVEDTYLEVQENRRIRHALEVRHPDSLGPEQGPELARIARDAGVALVFSDAADWAFHEEITAGWVYLRLHGKPETYVTRYEDDALEKWAKRIRTWHEADEPDEPDDADTLSDREPPERHGRDVYVYFDNDEEGWAPKDARRLMEKMGL